MDTTDSETCTRGDPLVMFYPPYPDELLSSWIIRNSIVQGSDPMGWIYGFWGEWRAWTRDIDRFLPKVRTIELARFSRLALNDIYNMTLTPIITCIEGETPPVNTAWKWVIPTGRRNRSIVGGLQFCPQCLNEKGCFFPRHWRLSWHTQCPVHHIRLFEKCEQCAMPFSPHLIDYTTPFVHLCPRCGKDLRQSKTVATDQDLLCLQQTLDILILSSYRNPYPQWDLHTRETLFLFLRDLLTLTAIISRKRDRYTQWQMFLFGRTYFDKLSSRAGMTFDMRSIEERSSLLRIALHLLKHNPAYLLKSLHYIHITQAILHDQHFPLSTMMQHTLSRLPPPKVIRQTQTKTTKPASKEPRTATEIKEEMRKIRKYL